MNKNVNLNYRVSGNGYPVVFLHGFLESISMWEYLDFPSHFVKIEFDLPGHGDSEDFDFDDFSIKQIAGIIREKLYEIGISDYSVVGHSLGAYVGVELMKLDGNCRKIVFLNSNFWEDSPQKKVDRGRVAKLVLKNKTSFIYEAIPHLFFNPSNYHEEVVRLIQDAKKISAKTIANYSTAMSKRESNELFVRENSSNVLIIQGEEDAIVSTEKMDAYFREINFQYEKMSPCGHMAHIEQTKDVLRVVLSFLED